jgi:putative SOS response-associated peptidase YedK
MCGRFEVNKSIVDIGVYQSVHTRFNAMNNLDQRPGGEVACLHHHHGAIVQATSYWGIKPDWAHHLIINAQSETVATKKTFSSAYALHRCVVPCSGWFEWTGESGHKQKHRFSPEGEGVLFMAGILFPGQSGGFQLVTLTCEADPHCGIYHHRMPLLIEESKVPDWLALPQATHELSNFHDHHVIKIEPPV